MNDDVSTASESTMTESPSDNNDFKLGSTASQDSSFYGGGAVKRQYEKRLKSVDTQDYWRVHEWNIQVVAARTVDENPESWPSTSKKRKRDNSTSETATPSKKNRTGAPKSESQDLELRPLPTKPHNPYEGLSTALQLDEPVSDFLQRLPPSSSNTSLPWIWCANFQADRRLHNPDLAAFKQIGLKLLEDFRAKRYRLETSFDPPKPAGSITRMLSTDRNNLEEDIVRAARSNDVVNGKWMLFPTPDEVDVVWASVVRGTVDGRLGSAAKVATKPDKPDEPTHVICIYTRDFEDKEDVKRVLLELVRLKLAKPVVSPLPKVAGPAKQIWYKPDCYTYLDLKSGNDFKIRPTLYGTASMLTREDLKGL